MQFRVRLASLQWPVGLIVVLLVGLFVGSAKADLHVTFFDVGQGDAALITSPTGKRVLIDAGPPEGQQALLSSLQKRQVSAIDLIILTHAHQDHLGGLPAVLRQIPARMFLDPGFSHPSPAYSNVLRLLNERNVKFLVAEAGRKIELGDGATLTLLTPPNPYLLRTRSDVNANSVVARLTWRSVSALFTGDAEPETESYLLSRPKDLPLQAGLLKVAHHGGKHSSTVNFLRAVQPRFAVISVASRNDYGHPTPEALNRLAVIGAEIHRTDQEGDITLRSKDGSAWAVEGTEQVQRPPQAERPALPQQGGYPASRRSPVFHRADCPAAAKIVPQNRVHYPTREAALQSGRTPAGDCHP